MKKILMLVLGLGVLSSCSTSNRVVSPREINNSSNLTDKEVNTTIIPVIADLEVRQERVSVTKTFSRNESMSKAKNETLRLALIVHKADFLLDPIFESTIIKNKTEITVSGWPVYYKSIKQIEEKDSRSIKSNPINLQKATIDETLIPEKKKRAGLWVALGTTFIGSMIAIFADN